MKMRRFRERLRYSMIGNLLVTLGLIACFYLGYLVFILIVGNAAVLKGFFWPAVLLFFCSLYLIYLLANYHKTKRYQRAVYGIGNEKKRAPAAARKPEPEAHDAILTMAGQPDEKALRRMERKREKAERSMERERAKAERREEKRNAKW